MALVHDLAWNSHGAETPPRAFHRGRWKEAGRGLVEQWALDDVDVVANIEKKREFVKSANRMTALGAYPLERRSGEGCLGSGTMEKNGTSLCTPS
jgi:hypothetical protein